jgi:SAM-dependent methyltransferase
MNLRIRLAQFLLAAGRFLQTLPVAVLRPADMVEWARVRYDRNSPEWNVQNDPDRGLTADEADLWEQATPRQGKLLILGGGGGREAVFFARRDWQVTALDVSDGMLAEARGVMQARGLALETVQGDLATFDAPPGSFDGVWTSMFLYSLVMGRARRIALLRRMRATLSPGGWLVVSFHVDPAARVGPRGDRLRRWIAMLTLGNRDYQNGDILFGTLEFRHSFANEAELRAEFAESGLEVTRLLMFDRMMRGGCVLMKREVPFAGTTEQRTTH